MMFLTGNLFMDMGILNNVFSVLICPTCYCKLKMTQNEKEGLAFRIILKCCGCEWKHEFYTSKKKSKHYEVNRRMVYVMRRCGLGYYGMKIFLTLMNHPPPMTEKNYRAINNVFHSATKKVTETVMREAKDELRTNDNG